MEQLRHRLDQDLTTARITSEHREQVATYIIIALCIGVAMCLAVLDSGATDGAIALTAIVACLLVRRRCGPCARCGVGRGLLASGGATPSRRVNVKDPKGIGS